MSASGSHLTLATLALLVFQPISEKTYGLKRPHSLSKQKEVSM